MDSSAAANSKRARTTLAGAWGVVCALILAAPILASHSCRAAASVIYLYFSFICHQIPERSFALSGYTLAVCHRCTGIYLGLFLGSLVENHFIHRSPRGRRFWVLAASAPLFLDVLLPYTGLWTSTCLSRFFSGLLIGNVISSLLVRGAAEFLSEAPWRRLAVGDSHLKGGFS